MRIVLLTVLAAGTLFGCASREQPVKEVTGCLVSDPNVEVPFSGKGVPSIQSIFDGFGCNSLATRGQAQAIHLRPASAAKPSETHAGLVLGPRTGDRLAFSCGETTNAQFRTGSEPNPHEVGWLVWGYSDNEHFYYFMAKPNGWELGKRDPAYPGGQRFLATGASPAVAIGRRCELKVVQEGPEISAYVDGEQVATFRDGERPYSSGRIGVYCEDADVYFDSLALE